MWGSVSLTQTPPCSFALQGVHESRGVTKDYLRLETLVQKVVSPYLGTYGLCSSEGPCTHSCILGMVLPSASLVGDRSRGEGAEWGILMVSLYPHPIRPQ